MTERILAVLLTAAIALLCIGCESRMAPLPDTEEPTGLVIFTEDQPQETAETVPGSSAEQLTELLTECLPETTKETSEKTSAVPDTIPEDEPLPASVEKDGSYTTPEDVAEYIHTFGTLPGNYITKNEAKALGWDSSAGNLWDVAPGKSIGGDRFGNREGLLPKGSYTECDVNYSGGYRGAERLIFGTDGSVYYTNDHYRTFTQLY